MELIEIRIAHECHHESSAIPLVQMYGSASNFPRIFIGREFEDYPPNTAPHQVWQNNVMAQDSFYEDEGALSDEDADFDEEVCISEPPLEAGFAWQERPGNNAGPPDEREWWSTQRRWF
jgi:hypothetical protein